VLAFDPAELRDAGVELRLLPDDSGYLIDTKSLPVKFRELLESQGLDTFKPIRIKGRMGRRIDGRPDRYWIHFEQA
jgi:hypothetical protein